MKSDEKQSQTPFFTALKDYVKSGVAPFDVPGHKLGRIQNDMIKELGDSIFLYDANAPYGLDNLSNPRGVIKEAENLCAELFNADAAYFIVGGTTTAIHAMIMSTCRARDTVLLPRNVHKSIVNALVLSGAVPVFMKPLIDEEYGFANSVPFEEAKRAIDENPDAKAIVLLNPTYFGAVSDLKRICDYAHERNISVLVDEAHGTQFAFNDQLPLSAMEAGADMAATSMHKTGGSLTQSSILLCKGSRNNYEYIRTVLNILQSTSPSSLLLASLDVARKSLAENGYELTSRAIEMRNYAVNKLKDLKRAKVLDEDYFLENGVFNYDKTRLVVSFKDMGYSGFAIYRLLKEKYNIQAELGEKYVVLFIFTGGTTLNDVNRLVEAIKDIDQIEVDQVFDEDFLFGHHFPEYVVRPREAFHAPKKYVNYLDAKGEISAESIMIYPPGIPLVIMGERIDDNVMKTIKFYLMKGFTILKDSDGEFIKVIDTENWIKRSDEDEI